MEEGIEKAGEQKHTGLGQVWAVFSERPAGRAQGVFLEAKGGISSWDRIWLGQAVIGFQNDKLLKPS